MKTNLFLSSLGLLAISATAQTEMQRPNVILLVADDLGYGDLSCYGAKGVETPCVDSIASHGIRFADAHACASTSTPSRYALFTGEYPFRKSGTGIAKGDESMIISPEQFTVADVFHAAGYATGAVGKWHLGLGSVAGKQDWNGTLDQHLGDLGFDYHYIMAATADRVPCAFIENGRIANLDPDDPIYVSYWHNFPGEPTGKDNPELLTKLKSSHGHNQSIVNGIGRIGFMKGGGRALWKDENIADSITAHAIQFMEQHADHPFFLYLGTNDVHVPRYPHERFRGKSPMGLRGEAILQFDWTVQQIANTLKRLGISDNTLLIITSDNGPVLDDGYCDCAVELVGDHRPSGSFRGGKYSVYEGGTAVPFIVNWPAKIPGGQESRALVSQVDNLASMAELVGVNIPEGAARDSRRQLTTWLGESQKSCPFAIAIGSGRTIDVREGKWKYIEPGKGGIPYVSGPHYATEKVTSRLYDLSASYKEDINISNSERELVIHFENLLDSVLMGDYPISFGKDEITGQGTGYLKGVEFETADGILQSFDFSSNKNAYFDFTRHKLVAKAGEQIVPKFLYSSRNKLNGYIYVDLNKDGIFNVDVEDQILPETGCEASAFSYFGKNNAVVGINSIGEELSGNSRFVLNPPAFTIPKNTEEGYYRLRIKVDYNDLNPNGSPSIVETGGRIVDVLLNIHSDQVGLSCGARHGKVLSEDGENLDGRQVAYGQPISLRLIPDKGYEISGVYVKHGYHFDEDSVSHHTMQWERIFFDRESFMDGLFTLPAAYVDGNVVIEGVFVEEGTYVKPEIPVRYETTTIVGGQFAAATPWYSMQISDAHNVLKNNGNADFISLEDVKVDINNPSHLWCFVGNEQIGYQIYNQEAGPGKILAAPINMTGRNGSTAYPLLLDVDKIPDNYISVWRFADSKDLGQGNAYAYLYEDGFLKHKINKRGEKLAFWTTGQDMGSTLFVQFVKYGDAVSGISSVKGNSASSDLYDLGGRKVVMGANGVYLKKGAKVYMNRKRPQ